MTVRRKARLRHIGVIVWLALAAGPLKSDAAPKAEAVDFNRDVRRVLSENCFSCHGPDAKESKGGRKSLRLDLPESAYADLGSGNPAIAPGHPEKSEVMRRITATDLDDRMPPPETGKTLSAEEVALLKTWIAQGAGYSRHWAYEAPRRPPLPKVREKSWPRNGIDHFILARLQREELNHSPEADRPTLIRRVALDLTGLPPTLEEVDQFLADPKPGAYERVVDRLLKKDAYGEHWAQLWLDQARYADSSGYADDPGRTIWAYRDYVIRSLNANKPFDQFTLEQIAGDLLPEPTEEQMVATAFHRNTMTNNEGGTSDEEYRNVAVVDRVNTTMAVWMGTTMACAQCHNHKYDPITQEDYFRLFAILNNTSDADLGDESPTLALYSAEQKRVRQELDAEIARREHRVRTTTPELARAQAVWEQRFATDLAWSPLTPAVVKSQAGAEIHVADDGTVRFGRGGATDIYTLEAPTKAGEAVTALRLEVFPEQTSSGRGVGHDEGNFVVSRIVAAVTPTNRVPIAARHVRVELTGKDRILSLAEVQVFRGSTNLAPQGEARQSSTAFEGPARLAIDGNADGDFAKARSTTHTETSTDPWWELDLKSAQAVDRIVLWNRTDGSQDRLSGFRVLLLGEKREVLWQETGAAAPNPNAEFSPDGARPIPIAAARATFSQQDFNAGDILGKAAANNRGWAIAPRTGEPHALTLTLKEPTPIGAGSNIVVTIEQFSKRRHATIARLRLSMSSDSRAQDFSGVPESTLAILRRDSAKRTDGEREEVRRHYLSIAPELRDDRDEIARLRKAIDEVKPHTTVPVLRELAGEKRRKTHVQLRGNFLVLGKEVEGGLPQSLHPRGNVGPGTPPDRLALARWLVDRDNPLTARVMANRLWESTFGIGLVRTSEEFGAQGELPSHPELLDWLAVELMEKQWNVKHLLRLLVTSAAYRQSSRVTQDLAARDPDNRLLARGPRFRLSAEMIRDQALHVSGLLSSKMHGPPVKPAQPKLGLSAAFGSGTDWETSGGEDRYRRALYTTWRRSNPYPSMATFDAPNREVCLVRRERSNTPLQALVTLNDPVYLEAAQAVARKMMAAGPAPADKASHGFRLCTSRAPADDELAGLLRLHARAAERFRAEPAKALDVATKPLGGTRQEIDAAELAAWTVVSSVLLNLDEVLMKR
jgi:mono/diheme cytochrome c family protein